jgi:alpha-1,3-rhamnosyl/mannosyltransferase
VVWFPWNGMRFESRAPAVVTINDDFAFAYPAGDRIARWREQHPIRRAVERAAAIMTISSWARATLLERFGIEPERVSVIPLAPDPLFTPGDEPAPFAERFVLAVGAREHRKNIAFFIDVFARAFPDNDLRLVIVGQLDDRLRALVRARSIRLTEYLDIDDGQLRRLYRTAAAVAVPSLAEGFGLVAAEAQACGAAVIAADASALPEAVGIAGILVDPRDANGWIAALRGIVRDSALNTYYRTQAALRWPTESRERTTDAVLSVLQRAIDNRA